MSRVSDSTLDQIEFRHSDSTNTMFAKLEKLRGVVVSEKGKATAKTLFLSITGGLPTAQGPLFRFRVPLDKTLIIYGAITGDANNAATGAVSLLIKKNGAANGTIVFTGTTGAGAATIGDYPPGSLFEIWPPVTADPTLDNVSLSIPIRFG